MDGNILAHGCGGELGDEMFLSPGFMNRGEQE
jgi:hypothetical protein